MHRAFYKKPDGRSLWLYSRRPLSTIPPWQILSPGNEPVSRSTERRWHPIRQEWVIYAGHRQNRTFLPDAQNNPLVPSGDPARPSELPVGEYDVAVFENRFPTMVGNPNEPERRADVNVEPAFGRCEVVVFSQDPGRSLWQL